MDPYWTSFKSFDFNLDDYINPFLPSNLLARFPRPISHFLGYRNHVYQEVGNVFISLWAIISTYIGLFLVGLAFRQTPWISSLDPPALIGSLGAAAILTFNTLSSPLAQPRNTILGHILSAIIGVAIAKSCLNSSASNAYLIAPLACGLSSAAMTLTGTIHPPGGATAVLAVTDMKVRSMGWMLVPVMAASCAIMLAVACLMGNLGRRYPFWWWSNEECGEFWKGCYIGDVEDGRDARNGSSSTDYSAETRIATSILDGKPAESHSVLITPYGIVYHPDLQLADKERVVLEALLLKLKKTCKL